MSAWLMLFNHFREGDTRSDVITKSSRGYENIHMCWVCVVVLGGIVCDADSTGSVLANMSLSGAVARLSRWSLTSTGADLTEHMSIV